MPDLLLVGRVDEVETIGRGLALAASGVGLRVVAGRLAVPYTTARSWWRRFQARAPTVGAALVALAVRLDGTPVELTGTGAAAALEGLMVAWQRARQRWGERVGELWRFWSRISGGQALATTTTVPWAGSDGAAWMALSR